MGFISKYAALLLAAVLVSCSGGGSSASGGGSDKDDIVTISSISSRSVTIDGKGGIANVTFKASGTWTAASSESWCKVSPATGKAGDAGINMTADANPESSARTATVTISCSSCTETITVLQNENESKLTTYPTPDRTQIPSFPGADGGGKYTTGGAGGTVYTVTNLNDSGEGSLRYGLETMSGKRTIVFAVSGLISLSSPIKITNGDLTVAGQTAPGDGICIRNYTVFINASNVIIRFMRFRMGDLMKYQDDALSSSHHDNAAQKNIIIDHCSMSWSVDECGSFYGNEDFTLQWCVLSESLRNSVHDKDTHGYGGIWGGERASFHHNLLAHHDSRNPRFDHDYVSTMKGPVHFVNNVVYNWGSNTSYGGESASTSTSRNINMVSNYYKSGPATAKNSYRICNPTTKCSNCSSQGVIPALFYITGNYVYGNSSRTSDNWSGVEPDDKTLDLSTIRSSSYLGTQHSFVESAESAFESVLRYSGASLSRDAIDERIMGKSGAQSTGGEVRDGKSTYTGSNGSTGGLIDSQEDVGGWPEYSSKAAPDDSDKDGMPDEWEKTNGLDANDAADGARYNLSPSYTNLEVYLNSLVEGTFPAAALK